MNKSEAIKATKNGAIAACISAALTIIIVLIAISSDAEGELAPWNDPGIFIDVVFVLACAFGMYKKSRAASVLIFFYFLASKVIIAIETQAFSGFGMALVFIYFYGKAIQGSFVYHRLEKEENPDYKATTKWTYIFGIPSVLIIVTLVGFGLLSTTGVVPSTRVVSASEIYTNDIATLRSNGVITTGDKVKYFYSQGFSSILESGNVLTQDRVILYLTDENKELQVYEISLNEITEVVLESQGDTFNDSVYVVNTNDPERWLKLYLSPEQKGDQKFVKAIRDNISR
ncbi:MAG: hypothetical protein V3R25_03430 [Nitrosomonadaceae bacterium]